MQSFEKIFSFVLVLLKNERGREREEDIFTRKEDMTRRLMIE